MIGEGPAFGANPSFFEMVGQQGLGSGDAGRAGEAPLAMPHGTTILALKFADGVVVAGDRRATEGHAIADRRMDKVYPADEYSTVAIAGVAAQAIEMVRLFQTELEHYEKVEGEQLSLEGKANRLSQMLRGWMPLIMQGLIVVPIFAGYDLRRGAGRIFRYDVIGGRYEEIDFHSTGSGGRDAKGSLKKRYTDGMSRDEAIQAAVEALVDAAEEDSATGGPDPERGIYPTVYVVTREGADEAPEDEVKAAYEVVQGRREVTG